MKKTHAAGKIGLIGFGDLGQQLAQFLEEQNKSAQIDCIIFDDKVHSATTERRIYPFSCYEKDEFRDLVFYVCLGYQHLPTRHEIIKNLKAAGRSIGTFVHRTAYVHSTATIGDGVIIYPGCILDQAVSIGDGCILNNAVVISHGTKVGSASFFAPRVTVCGNVQVGTCAFVGAASVISNGVAVGNNARVGIGSVITKRVADTESIIGNPARTLNTPLRIS